MIWGRYGSWVGGMPQWSSCSCSLGRAVKGRRRKMVSSGKESALSKRRFTHVDAVHVHDNLPSRQDAQPQVPWRPIVGGAKRGTHTQGHTHACHARTQTTDRPERGGGRECQGGEGGGQGGPAHVHGPCPRECIEGGLLRFRPGPSPYGCRWGPLAMRLGASGSLLRLSRRARTSP